jgi:hypothetical protein
LGSRPDAKGLLLQICLEQDLQRKGNLTLPEDRRRATHINATLRVFHRAGRTSLPDDSFTGIPAVRQQKQQFPGNKIRHLAAIPRIDCRIHQNPQRP